MKNEFVQFTLPNGIRVIHKEHPGSIGHMAFIFNMGTRNELPHENGIAHFIEHCVFKGTTKRKAYHVLTRLEDVGGEINAYTGKEDISLYASFMSEYFERAIELLTDISFHSTYPVKEIEKEKDVVVDEINSYKDSPSELIFDDMEGLVFHNHSLGHNILGTPETVRSFKRKDIFRFVLDNFDTSELVISTTGDISAKKLRKILDKHVSAIPQRKRSRADIAIPEYKPVYKELDMDTYQTHVVLANRSYAVNDKKASVMSLVNNLLGGPAMSARLNLSVREKYGFTYNIESFYTPYSDTGIFGIYLGTDEGAIEKSIRLVYKELAKLREQKLGTIQLHKAQRQMMGQLSIAQENNLSNMLAFGKSYMVFDKVDDLDTILTKIESITAEEIQEVANAILLEDQMSTLIYKSK